MNGEGEAVTEAWQEDKGDKEPSLAEKTKKHLVLETSLFCLVAASFLLFNVYYWTRQREY